MKTPIKGLFTVAGLLCAGIQPLVALQAKPQATTSPRLSACSLLSKEEVKKHLPWRAALDQLKVEEDPIGASGSGCSFPTVYVQVMPFSPNFLEAARKRGGLEAVAGVGDEAYFHNNRDRYAELFVRVGKNMVTLQGNVPHDGTIDATKPKVIALGKAYAAKLR